MSTRTTCRDPIPQQITEDISYLGSFDWQQYLVGIQMMDVCPALIMPSRTTVRDTIPRHITAVIICCVWAHSDGLDAQLAYRW